MRTARQVVAFSMLGILVVGAILSLAFDSGAYLATAVVATVLILLGLIFTMDSEIE